MAGKCIDDDDTNNNRGKEETKLYNNYTTFDQCIIILRRCHQILRLLLPK